MKFGSPLPTFRPFYLQEKTQYQHNDYSVEQRFETCLVVRQCETHIAFRHFDETVWIPRVLRIICKVDPRLCIKFDQDRRVRNRNEAAILRIERQVVRPRG